MPWLYKSWLIYFYLKRINILVSIMLQYLFWFWLLRSECAEMNSNWTVSETRHSNFPSKKEYSWESWVDSQHTVMEKRVIALILVCATTNAGVHETYITNLVFKNREPKAILNHQILMVSHELGSQPENMAKTDLIFFKEEIGFLEVYFNPLITSCTSFLHIPLLGSWGSRNLF